MSANHWLLFLHAFLTACPVSGPASQTNLCASMHCVRAAAPSNLELDTRTFQLFKKYFKVNRRTSCQPEGVYSMGPATYDFAKHRISQIRSCTAKARWLLSGHTRNCILLQARVVLWGRATAQAGTSLPCTRCASCGQWSTYLFWAGLKPGYLFGDELHVECCRRVQWQAGL